jgi:Asp-tRNA(Asn)/Glu-tRNA(Gln) amidotransferase B subunit
MNGLFNMSLKCVLPLRLRFDVNISLKKKRIHDNMNDSNHVLTPSLHSNNDNQYTSPSDPSLSTRVPHNNMIEENEWEIIPYMTEIKNVNSLSSVQSCIDYEYNRQINEYGHSDAVELKMKDIDGYDTRTWNEKLRKTQIIRNKFDKSDYR